METTKEQSSHSCTLCVSNLPKGMDSLELHETFKKFGEISTVKVSTNLRTGQSHDYGVVTFKHSDAANAAIKAMDGVTLSSTKSISVTRAQRISLMVLGRMTKLSTLYDGVSEFGQLLSFRIDGDAESTEETKETSSDSQRTLLACNLPMNVDEQELMDTFRRFGLISTVQVCRDQLTKISLGFGLITFEHQQDAANALKDLHFSMVCGGVMFVSWAQDATIEELKKYNRFCQETFEEIKKCKSLCYETKPDPVEVKSITPSLGERLTTTLKSIFWKACKEIIFPSSLC